MNKVLINRKYVRIAGICIIGIFAAAIAQASTRTVTTYDEFNGTSLRPFWTLEDTPASYSSGGFTMPGDGIARFNNVGNYAYAHIQTTSTYDTTAGIRVDAIMRQDNTPTSSWAMGVAIYFDHGNFVALKQGAAGDQAGWLKYGFVNGTNIYQAGNTAVDLRSYFLISGVELTATQIKFYGSNINPMYDNYGETNIDDNVYEITEFTMARPASFTGNALVIVGKGYESDASYALNPDFDNHHPNGSDNWAFCGIDYVRIKRVVIDPNNCGDAGTVYLEMDFNEDCIVDFEDLGDFASQWLQCTDPQDPYCAQFLP
ncbi:MAG: hypothetical protein ACYC3B_09670 [Sedimentisphaerales bacterium]